MFSPTVADRLGRFFAGLATGAGRAGVSPADRAGSSRSSTWSPAASRTGGSPATLHLSDKTVRNHVSNVLAKLDVEDRSEAIARARAAGLGG